MNNIIIRLNHVLQALSSRGTVICVLGIKMLRNITLLRIDSVQPYLSPQTSEDLLYDEVCNGIT